MYHFNALATAVVGHPALRGTRRHLSTLLGLPVLARDEPGRRHHHLHAGHHGVPAGPRHRPPRDARTRADPRRTRPCACSARRRCPVEVDQVIRSALRHRDVQRCLRRDRSQPRLLAAARRREPAQRRRRRQRRVLRRAHLRRRRPRGAAGYRRRDRAPAQATPGDVRGLLGPPGRDGAHERATSGTTPATSAGSTRTATSTSSTARPTTCAGGARTSPASRWSGSSWATETWPTWRSMPSRAR